MVLSAQVNTHSSERGSSRQSTPWRSYFQRLESSNPRFVWLKLCQNSKPVCQTAINKRRARKKSTISLRLQMQTMSCDSLHRLTGRRSQEDVATALASPSFYTGHNSLPLLAMSLWVAHKTLLLAESGPSYASLY